MIEIILNILILLISSFVLKMIINYTGNKWVNTYSNVATFLLLPIVTYVITSVIKTNIALSLGMVGALSIVRFRNPVRSSYELVLFFLLITLGITASVNIYWTLILSIVSAGIIILLELLNIIYRKLKNKNYFEFSFNEANEMSSLELESSKELSELIENKNLKNFTALDNNYIYRFIFNDSIEAKKLYKTLQNYETTKKIEINIVE